MTEEQLEKMLNDAFAPAELPPGLSEEAVLRELEQVTQVTVASSRKRYRGIAIAAAVVLCIFGSIAFALSQVKMGASAPGMAESFASPADDFSYDSGANLMEEPTASGSASFGVESKQETENAAFNEEVDGFVYGPEEYLKLTVGESAVVDLPIGIGNFKIKCYDTEDNEIDLHNDVAAVNIVSGEEQSSLEIKALASGSIRICADAGEENVTIMVSVSEAVD